MRSYLKIYTNSLIVQRSERDRNSGSRRTTDLIAISRCVSLLIVGRLIVVRNVNIVPVTKGELTSDLKSFGIALRTLRERASISQEALAHICGLHRTYIGSVERGERNISLLNIHVLAGALNVKASELIRAAEGIQQPPPQSRRSSS